MTRRSPWGSIRRLPSGRFQARYRVDDVEHRAPSTFATKRYAEAFLAGVRTDLERGTWVDAGTITFAEYSARWLEERPLRPRSVELYEGLLRLHTLPTFEKTNLADLKPPAVRTWHARLLAGPRPGASTTAKAYRLLRGILATAVDDEIIDRNPCRIRGAGVEHPAERPIATIEEVYALAEAIEPRYRVMVLTATLAGLRLGAAGAHAPTRRPPAPHDPGRRAAPRAEGRLGVPGNQGSAVPARELLHRLEARHEGGRPRTPALPRPSPHRRDIRRDDGCDDEGAHVPSWPRITASRAHIPTPDCRPRPRHRRRPRQHRRRGADIANRRRCVEIAERLTSTSEAYRILSSQGSSTTTPRPYRRSRRAFASDRSTTTPITTRLPGSSTYDEIV